jgi:hypothetical protein
MVHKEGEYIYTFGNTGMLGNHPLDVFGEKPDS